MLHLCYHRNMSKVIRISDDLVRAATTRAAATNRSVQKQIEYWTMLGKTAEDNPDLPLSFIEDAIQGIREYEAGEVSELTSL